MLRNRDVQDIKQHMCQYFLKMIQMNHFFSVFQRSKKSLRRRALISMIQKYVSA